MSLGNAATDDSFVAPNEENLKNLGPGCFVRVVNQSENVWVEITDVDGEQCRGILQSDSSAKVLSITPNTEITLQKEQINAFGCDRFCYCD